MLNAFWVREALFVFDLFKKVCIPKPLFYLVAEVDLAQVDVSHIHIIGIISEALSISGVRLMDDNAVKPHLFFSVYLTCKVQKRIYHHKDDTAELLG